MLKVFMVFAVIMALIFGFMYLRSTPGRREEQARRYHDRLDQSMETDLVNSLFGAHWEP